MAFLWVPGSWEDQHVWRVRNMCKSHTEQAVTMIMEREESTNCWTYQNERKTNTTLRMRGKLLQE